MQGAALLVFIEGKRLEITTEKIDGQKALGFLTVSHETVPGKGFWHSPHA
jgi:hypothetical protein